MYIRSLLSRVLRFLVPVALCTTFYLYLYPVFHGCAFPSTDASIVTAFGNTIRQHAWVRPEDAIHRPSSLAPFRLLILADPQLEGDSSLPKPADGLLPRLGRHWVDLRNTPWPELRSTVKTILRTIYSRDIPDALNASRKRLDLFGNDYYLAHIYRTLHWWSKSTHVTVLGDLIGSQWVTDEEFEWRGWRYWNRVFAGGLRAEAEEKLHKEDEGGQKPLVKDDGSWTNRIINIAGNHDIGYAGDVSKARLERFERIFGRSNWDFRIQYNDTTENATGTMPTLHVVILNTLNLDTPALDEELQHESYEFINSIITKGSKPVEDRTSFTLLLTHLPLHKKAGICVDPPYFDYWGDDDGGGVYRPHGVKEQNHLSDYASRHGVLEGMFGFSGVEDAPAGGKGRSGLILNGHDHEGCDVWHCLLDAPSNTADAAIEDQEDKSGWQAANWKDAKLDQSQRCIREVTLRSMMGQFGGNAGLLSAWFDFEKGEWQYGIQMCKAGVQHIWWAVHVLDVLTTVLVLLQTALLILSYNVHQGHAVGKSSRTATSKEKK